MQGIPLALNGAPFELVYTREVSMVDRHRLTQKLYEEVAGISNHSSDAAHSIAYGAKALRLDGLSAMSAIMASYSLHVTHCGGDTLYLN